MTGDDDDDSVCTESEFESDYKEEDNRDTLPIDQDDVLTILAVLGEKPTDERKMWRDFLRTICKDYFNFDENVSSQITTGNYKSLRDVTLHIWNHTEWAGLKTCSPRTFTDKWLKAELTCVHNSRIKRRRQYLKKRAAADAKKKAARGEDLADDDVEEEGQHIEQEKERQEKRM